MLSNENIKDILNATRHDVDERDLAFLVLCDNYKDIREAYKIAYGKTKSEEYVRNFRESDKISALVTAAKPFGVCQDGKVSISREENQSALIKMLGQIEQAMDDEEMDKGQALKMMADIRVKLQDKFDMEDDKDENKHIIVVPQKHDYICPHTNRECSKMPSKAACMKYYGLRDSGGGEKIQDEKPFESQPPKKREDLVLDIEKPTKKD